MKASVNRTGPATAPSASQRVGCCARVCGVVVAAFVMVVIWRSLAIDQRSYQRSSSLSLISRLINGKLLGMRRRHPDAKPRPRLDLDLLVQAAIAVLDQEGLDGLTTRRLAARLGVQSPALYWYVRDKDELLDLVAEAICAPALEPTAASTADRG